MKKDFKDRRELVDYLAAKFPQAATIDAHISEIRGGRSVAEAKLKATNLHYYEKTRNYLNGAITGLSPYIRHGVLSLHEVAQYAYSQADHPKKVEKFVQELAYRDYFQRVYAEIGDGIWQERENYKTGFDSTHYADNLPHDIQNAETGLDCIDAFVEDLYQTGYVHNHARMYLAAYLVHFRGVHWRAGAEWFLQHLIDGDPASNNLSWQWIASTFSSKPYIFNRENLEKFTNGVYCRDCPLYKCCIFEPSYDELHDKLFPYRPDDVDTEYAESQSRSWDFLPPNDAPPTGSVVWVHGDNLNPYSAALQALPNAPAVFVFDDALLEQWQISLKRIVFMYECLLELPVEVRRGDVASELMAFADEQGSQHIVTMTSPSPRFESLLRRLDSEDYAVHVMPEEPFLAAEDDYDMRRFSRFWRKAKKHVAAKR